MFGEYHLARHQLCRTPSESFIRQLNVLHTSRLVSDFCLLVNEHYDVVTTETNFCSQATVNVIGMVENLPTRRSPPTALPVDTIATCFSRQTCQTIRVNSSRIECPGVLAKHFDYTIRIRSLVLPLPIPERDVTRDKSFTIRSHGRRINCA